MKRITIALTIALYLIPAIGFSVKAHYCGGKLASVSFDLSGSADCTCGNKKMKKSCCKTKICTFKLQDTQKHSQEFTFDHNNFKIQPELNLISGFLFQPITILESSYNKHHPPNDIKQQLYILHQVFRI